MNVAYYHASRYGNGRAVAEEFARAMATRGVEVQVQHVDDADPKHLPLADLYVFSSPGRMGRPRRSARRFLHRAQLPFGSRYALLTTEMAPQPHKRTGTMPSPEEIARWQRVRPIMDDLLRHKGASRVAEDCVHVTGMQGPLEEGWAEKVDAFAERVASAAHLRRG